MSLSNKVLINCEQKKANCFANENGCCRILNNTHFKKVCPFYQKQKHK